MVMVMVVRMHISLGRCGALFSGQPFDAIAEAAYLLFYAFGFAAAIMQYSHRACRHRNGNLFHTRHTAYGGINLRRAGCTIHAVHAKTNLVYCLIHDLPFQSTLELS